MGATKHDTESPGTPIGDASGVIVSVHARGCTYGSGSQVTQEIRAKDEPKVSLPDNAWTWTVTEEAPRGAKEFFERQLDHAIATGSQPDDSDEEDENEPGPRF